jgi:hypothetical protein
MHASAARGPIGALAHLTYVMAPLWWRQAAAAFSEMLFRARASDVPAGKLMARTNMARPRVFGMVCIDDGVMAGVFSPAIDLGAHTGGTVPSSDLSRCQQHGWRFQPRLTPRVVEHVSVKMLSESMCFLPRRFALLQRLHVVLRVRWVTHQLQQQHGYANTCAATRCVESTSAPHCVQCSVCS